MGNVEAKIDRPVDLSFKRVHAAVKRVVETIHSMSIRVAHFTQINCGTSIGAAGQYVLRRSTTRRQLYCIGR